MRMWESMSLPPDKTWISALHSPWNSFFFLKLEVMVLTSRLWGERTCPSSGLVLRLLRKTVIRGRCWYFVRQLSWKPSILLLDVMCNKYVTSSLPTHCLSLWFGGVSSPLRQFKEVTNAVRCLGSVLFEKIDYFFLLRTLPVLHGFLLYLFTSSSWWKSCVLMSFQAALFLSSSLMADDSLWTDD